MHRVFAIGVLLAVCSVATGEGLVVPGKRVPSLSDLRWIYGEPVDRFEMGRVYVLEFWSTWCGACIESVDKLSETARRYKPAVKFIAIHIWQHDSAPKPAEFLEKRFNPARPINELSVAEDLHGAAAKAWMDATASPGLPTAMIIDRASRLAWVGHARDLESPLKEIVEGTFDLPCSVAQMNLRMRVGRLANESGKAIENGEHERGTRLILEAFDADPNTVAAWIPSTYGHLLATSRSPEVAAGFANTVLATDAGKRTELLAGLASAILHFRPEELRDLDLALTLATRADAITNGRDAQIKSMVAMIRSELGDRLGAIRELELAIQDAPNEAVRELLAKTLNDLRDLSHE